MARFVAELIADVDRFVQWLDERILETSASASREESVDTRIGGARMLVRGYERYSAFGGNRVSLTVSVLAVGERLTVVAVTTGGSEALLWKVNTVGEETFLRKAVDAIQGYPGDELGGALEAGDG